MIHQWSKFWLSGLILKVQRTSVSFKSSIGALEDAGGSWLEFVILILISIWSLVFDILMVQMLALFFDFEGAKNLHVFYVLIWQFGGHCKFLTWVWNLDLYLDMVSCPWFLHDPNLALSLDFEGPKKIHVSRSWFRGLEDAASSWLGFVILILIWIWPLVFDTPVFQILSWYIDFEGAKNIHVL